MAKVQGDPLPDKPLTEQADGQSTPAPEDTGDKDGLHLAAPRKVIVGDYPERPYKEAITDPHRDVLRAAGQEPV